MDLIYAAAILFGMGAGAWIAGLLIGAGIAFVIEKYKG